MALGILPGIPLPGAAMVGTAAANAAVNVHHALKVNRMQQRFQRILHTNKRHLVV